MTNTRGSSSVKVIRHLIRLGMKLNVTAILTLDQVWKVTRTVQGGPPAYISVFAGRIADTRRNPVPLMSAAVEIVRLNANIELIWASPRELLNIFQADGIGCHIITVTNDILKKRDQLGKNLQDFSLDTLKMFH